MISVILLPSFSIENDLTADGSLCKNPFSIFQDGRWLIYTKGTGKLIEIRYFTHFEERLLLTIFGSFSTG
jgi:hypothetical protein